jgi:hypothetical protein
MIGRKNFRADLEGMLRDLEHASSDIEGAAIARTDGLVVAFTMPRETDETLVAAMSAAMINIGTQTAKQLDKGDIEKVIVRGTRGDIVLMGAGSGKVLSGITKPYANIGLVLVEMKRTSSKLSQVMKEAA